MAEELKINGKSEKEFLASYYHNHESVSEIGLEWPTLVELHDYYKNFVYNLGLTAQGEFVKLRDIKGAYIVKYRVKDPEHVVDKAIRKKEEKGIIVTKDNLLENFDDLIGFRILHLFKNGWEPIHEYITNSYELNEEPVVYHRKGDSEEFLKHCVEVGLKPKEKAAGYRSIHYIVKLKNITGTITSEIQVRTVIEDAWGEIDHIVRYPNNTDNELLNRYLLIFNTLAGSADEMGTFLMYLKQSIINKEAENQREINNLTSTIDELKKEIANLKDVNEGQKQKIDDLMTKIDSGVELWQKPASSIWGKSVVDIVSQIQNPSGLTGNGLVQEMQSNLEDYLKTLNPLSGTGLSQIGDIELPKPFSPISSLEELAKVLGKSKN